MRRVLTARFMHETNTFSRVPTDMAMIRRRDFHLENEIPAAFRGAQCYTDFWEAYSNVIPVEQHSAVGKESGQTAHVERWNLALRQRLARFVRRTLSFSKSSVMHEACLRLFIHRYNCSHALTPM